MPLRVAQLSVRPAHGRRRLVTAALGVVLAATVGTRASAAAHHASPAPRDDERVEAAPVAALLADPAQLTEWVRTHNPEVLAAGERVTQADEDRQQAGVYQNPALDLELGTIDIGDSNPGGLSVTNTAHFSVGVNQTVELGKRGPRMASARLRRDAAREDYVALLADKIGDARTALGKVAYLEARQTVLEQNLASARQVLDLEKKRLEHGDISESDWQRLSLDTQSLELDVEKNHSDVRVALAACGAALGARCVDDGLDPTKFLGAVELPASLPDVDDALADRPDQRSLALQRDSSRQDAELARHRKIPDPTFGLSYTHDTLTIAGNQPNSVTFTVGLPIPLFDDGRHDSAKAESHARELDDGARAARAQARAEVAGLLDERAYLEAAIAKLETDSIPRSKEVLENTRKAYDLGHVSLSDLILAERAHRELTIKLMDLRFELFGVKSELRQALGLDAALARTGANG